MRADNALIEVEMGQIFSNFTLMSDSGDHKVFTVSGAPLWSGKSGYAPTVRPNGVVSGSNMVSASSTNNVVDVAAFDVWIAGVAYTIAADTVTITRPATDVAKVNSIVVDGDDQSLKAVAGTDGSGTTFSETRGANGGPPLIDAQDIEIAQVRVTVNADGLITAAEIYQVDGAHCERATKPVFDINGIGEGEAATVAAKKNAYVAFASALPLIHTGPTPKRVYVSYNTPIFSEIARGVDFVPAEETHSVSSTQVYRGTIGQVSSSLGQASFTAMMDDGVTDALVGEKNQKLTVRFYPDENQNPYILTQGKIGISRRFPVDEQIQATVTISAEAASAEFSS